MYLPQHFDQRDRAALHALIAGEPLGAWVLAGAGGELVANHVPFLLDADRGEHGTLVAHVARANPVWRLLAEARPSLVMFQGAQSYVSPAWYPSKQAHGKVVPTWNYAVVHAHGTARAIEDRDWLLALVSRLTGVHEAARAQPWAPSEAPADYVERMLEGIVGIEIPIARLVGKWKTSQNRDTVDRLGVAAALEAKGDARSSAMAALVRGTAGEAER